MNKEKIDILNNLNNINKENEIIKNQIQTSKQNRKKHFLFHLYIKTHY